MKTRQIETGLALFTLGVLCVYVPIETWASLPHGLGHPMFLVDVVGMILLLYGALFSLRLRPEPAIGPLAAAWAWSAANGWRATSWRWLEVADGGQLEHGNPELMATAVGTSIALACCAISLVLASRSRPRGN